MATIPFRPLHNRNDQIKTLQTSLQDANSKTVAQVKRFDELQSKLQDTDSKHAKQAEELSTLQAEVKELRSLNNKQAGVIRTLATQIRTFEQEAAVRTCDAMNRQFADKVLAKYHRTTLPEHQYDVTILKAVVSGDQTCRNHCWSRHRQQSGDSRVISDYRFC